MVTVCAAAEENLERENDTKGENPAENERGGDDKNTPVTNSTPPTNERQDTSTEPVLNKSGAYMKIPQLSAKFAALKPKWVTYVNRVDPMRKNMIHFLFMLKTLHSPQVLHPQRLELTWLNHLLSL